MFENPQDEEKLCQVLKAYVEEWGPENVTVHLPAAWYNPSYSLGPTKLLFSTDSTIEIHAGYGPAKVQYNVAVQSSMTT